MLDNIYNYLSSKQIFIIAIVFTLIAFEFNLRVEKDVNAIEFKTVYILKPAQQIDIKKTSQIIVIL